MIQNKLNKKTIILINLILGQVLIGIIITGYLFLQNSKFPLMKQINKEYLGFLFFLISIGIGIVAVFVFNEIINLTHKEAEAKISEQRLKDSQDLIQVLRSNQHDFINHLQVIYSAAQLGKLDEANEYFHGIVKQVKELGAVSRITYPEIAALIHSKIAKAEELSAIVTITINTDLKSLPISPIDLSRILGNLLDNAIFAIKEVALDKRELAIKIIEGERAFTFTVFNRYPIIPESLQEKIFEAGYSTKGDEGSGLGLANVKSLVTKNHGIVNVVSKVDEGTSFIVNIEK